MAIQKYEWTGDGVLETSISADNRVQGKGRRVSDVAEKQEKAQAAKAGVFLGENRGETEKGRKKGG